MLASKIPKLFRNTGSRWRRENTGGNMRSEETQEQFTRLWTEALPTVAAYVHAVVRDTHVAKDLVQETAMVLLRKFAEWDSSREFLPWALGVAKLEILAHRRDTGRSRLVFDDILLDAITESWAKHATEIDGEQAALHDCLEKLAPHAREIVRLRYYDELKTPQIAERLGSTAGAVRISLMRIRQQLQGCVEMRLRSEGGVT